MVKDIRMTAATHTRVRRRTRTSETRRRRNFRQLLLRASRIVNRHVVQGLQARGYTDLRSTHTTLLSNIKLAGSSLSMAADRAGITKQAMGRLAAELAESGYITIDDDPKDARARLLRLTKRGRALMLESFELMADLERRYARMLGADQFAAVLAGLRMFVDIAGAKPTEASTSSRASRRRAS